MSHLRSIRTRRVLSVLLALAFAAPVAATATLALGPAQVIKSAACKGYTERTNVSPKVPGADDSSESGCREKGGLTGFVNAANAIVDPAVIAMIAVAPIACLVGAGSLFFGSRRGLMIIGSALGTLVFVISVKGIVA
jgi:hypothetical protein